MRVVLDPNVLISARLSPNGAPGLLVRQWLAGRFELLVSSALLAELGDVLQRNKFRGYLSVEEAREFVDSLRVGATLVDDPPASPQGSPDPDDDYLLALARAHGVDRLVSGDPHLTSMDSAEPRIQRPRDFLNDLMTGGHDAGS